MSNRPPIKLIKQEIHIMGSGCSALSLAARADELPNHQMTIVYPSGAPIGQEHIWAFWRIKGLEKAANLSRHKWNSWCLKTTKGNAILSSEQYAYHALQRTSWENQCRELAKSHGVKFVEQEKLKTINNAQVIDSRPPPIPTGQMFQYFVGWEISTPKKVFDSKIAILMDFRCDQSRGIHFIYVLPFSDRIALIESTMFSLHRESDAFFETAINEYISKYCGIHEFTINRVEKGAIPLGRFPKRNNPHIGIGGNGGAIRPSSGYAFAFIQKQISLAIKATKSYKRKKNEVGPLKIRCPHRSFDLWMDEVFLMVLRHWPTAAPEIFLRMAQALNGKEFALFLSGEPSWSLRIKVVLAMPKWTFIKATYYFLIRKSNPVWKNRNLASQSIRKK